MDRTAADIDLEKATRGTSREPPNSPNSQSTWESQNGTLNSPMEGHIDINEDTEEESGKFKGENPDRTPPTNPNNSPKPGASTWQL
jgi:hypothetical protein